MNPWRKQFKFDPLPPLLDSGNVAVQYFARRDLLGERVGPVNKLWQLPEAQKILKKQQADGSWPRAGEHQHPAINYGLIETWRWFRYLIDQYGFTRDHPQAQQAAEFLFSCQTDAGDFRGILANQYATYYSGAITSLLIKAGYADDPRVERSFQWLLAMRQNDGGWTIPMITHKLDRQTQYRLSSEYAEPLDPDRSKPFSHNATGMILRAFAAQPKYRKSKAAKNAAQLLASRFFQPDVYTSYQAASYWVRFEYPFWWNQLVAALDSVSLIGLPLGDEPITRALNWLIDHQQPNGLWRVSYVQPRMKEKETAKVRDMQLWISLAICRVFKRFMLQ
jgi:Prenyltransferase and squalene oxidase repeat